MPSREGHAKSEICGVCKSLRKISKTQTSGNMIRRESNEKTRKGNRIPLCPIGIGRNDGHHTIGRMHLGPDDIGDNSKHYRSDVIRDNGKHYRQIHPTGRAICDRHYDAFPLG